MHPPGTSGWPVVRPLPKIVLQVLLMGMYIAGQLLLWNDRRVLNSAEEAKPVGVPAFK